MYLMKKKMFVIPFRGLKEGKHQFDYVVEDTFFEVYPYEDILGSNVTVKLDFIKKSTILELNFSAIGDVKIACDVTNELFQQPIAGELNLVVKFGEDFNDENEEVLILPHEAYEIDVAQYIFEMIVLSLPSKRIHPGVIEGTLKSDILDKLEELQPKEKKNNKISDPRWDKLKELLTDKKYKDGTS
jgi:uncharacterized metal-binding protein YceD (DUF177 family)